MAHKYLTPEEQKKAPLERLVNLTTEEDEAVVTEIRDDLINSKKMAKQPTAVFIIGQPGAGKSTKLAPIATKLFQQEGEDFCKIDYDELRLYHPYKNEIINRDPKMAIAHIARASKNWFSEVLTMAYVNNMNIIIDMPSVLSHDGNFTTSTARYANLLKQIGYKIDVHAMAVNQEESYLGCVQRAAKLYEQDLSKSNLVPVREISRNEHDLLCAVETSALDELQSKKLANNIYIWNREDTTPLLKLSLDNPEEYTNNLASDTVKEERAKPLTGKQYIRMISDYKTSIETLKKHLGNNNDISIFNAIDGMNSVVSKHSDFVNSQPADVKIDNSVAINKIKKANSRG